MYHGTAPWLEPRSFDALLDMPDRLRPAVCPTRWLTGPVNRSLSVSPRRAVQRAASGSIGTLTRRAALSGPAGPDPDRIAAFAQNAANIGGFSAPSSGSLREISASTSGSLPLFPPIYGSAFDLQHQAFSRRSPESRVLWP